MSTVKVRAGEYRVTGAGGADMGHVVKQGRYWVATDIDGDGVGSFPTLKATWRGSPGRREAPQRSGGAAKESGRVATDNVT